MATDTTKLERIIAMLQHDESLADCFLEMIDTVEDEKRQLKTGDDAEEAVVAVIRKAGSVMLEKWLRKKEEEAERAASLNPKLRPHQKKRFVGTPPLEI